MCWFSYFGCLHWKIKELIYIVPMHKAMIFSHSKTFMFPHKHRTINDIFNIVFIFFFIYLKICACCHNLQALICVHRWREKKRQKQNHGKNCSLLYMCVYKTESIKFDLYFALHLLDNFFYVLKHFSFAIRLMQFERSSRLWIRRRRGTEQLRIDAKIKKTYEAYDLN